MSGYTELRYDVDDHVAIITLDRPEARNALTFTTYAELTDAVADHEGTVPRGHRPRSGVLFG